MAGEEDIGDIGVFWDHSDLPIGDAVDPDLMYWSLASALANKGYEGHLKIFFYVDKHPIPDSSRPDYEEARFHFFTGVPGDKSMRAKLMIRDILLWAGENRDRHPLNLVVVSNYIPQEKNLVGVLQDLQSRDYRVLLVQMTSDMKKLVETSDMKKLVETSDMKKLVETSSQSSDKKKQVETSSQGSDKKKLAEIDSEDFDWLWISILGVENSTNNCGKCGKALAGESCYKKKTERENC